MLSVPGSSSILWGCWYPVVIFNPCVACHRLPCPSEMSSGQAEQVQTDRKDPAAEEDSEVSTTHRLPALPVAFARVAHTLCAATRVLQVGVCVWGGGGRDGRCV